MRPIPEATEAFWSCVDKSGDCWLWLGARSAQGYGLWRGMGVHRVALNSTLPAPQPRRRTRGIGGHSPTISHPACHHCDNPPCVNPAHLYWRTAGSNAHDRSVRHPKCEYVAIMRGWRRCNGLAVHDLGDVVACGPHRRLVVDLGRTDIPTIHDLAALAGWSAEKKREAGQ